VPTPVTMIDLFTQTGSHDSYGSRPPKYVHERSDGAHLPDVIKFSKLCQPLKGFCSVKGRTSLFPHAKAR